MRVFWEKVRILGPIYRLAGQGFNDRDIAEKLDLTEVRVRDCVAWIVHFLGFTDRAELVRHAAPPLMRATANVDAPLPSRIAASLSL